MQNIVKKTLNKSKKVEKLLQEFYDINLTDPFLLDVADRYNKSLAETGQHDESIMAEGYDYLEKKFQDLQLKIKGKKRRRKVIKDESNGVDTQVLEGSTST